MIVAEKHGGERGEALIQVSLKVHINIFALPTVDNTDSRGKGRMKISLVTI